MFNLAKTLNDLKTDAKLTELDLSQQKVVDEKADAKAEAKCVATLITGHSGSVHALAVLPDGRLASGSYQEIKLWDTKSGDCKTLTGHSGSVYALAVLPDGRLASSGITSSDEDGSINLWTTQSGSCLLISTRHSGSVNALAVLPDGRLAIGSRDNSIKMWNVKSERSVHSLRKGWFSGTGHSDEVHALAVLPDGRLASGSADKSIKLWDTGSGDCRGTLTGHSDRVYALVVLPDGRLASGSRDSSIKLWDTKSGTCQHTLNEHSSFVTDLAVLPDGRLASGSYDKSIKLWDTKSGTCQHTLTGHSDAVCALAVLPDGRLVSASGSADKSIKLWDVKTMPERALRLSDVEPVLTALPNSAVQRLNLQHVQLADEAVPTLSKLVSDAKHLTTLDLCHTAITRTGIEALHKTNRQRPAPLQLLHEAMPDILAAEKKAEAAARSAPPPRPPRPTLVLPSAPAVVASAPAPAPAPAPAVAKQGPGVNTLLGEVNRKLERLQFGQQEGNREIVQQVGDLRRDQAQAQEKQQPTSPSSPTSPSLSFSYTINYTDLEIQQELGRGGFGVVYRGTWRYAEVAVKELLITAPTSAALQEFNSEIQVMTRLRSPYIVQFYGACMGSPKYALVMEYMPGGSLYSLLHNDQALAWETRYRIITDIACGLAFLHAEHILHLDLKSLNVLLDGSQRAKLCDFGLAKIRTETRTTTAAAKSTGGTLAWMGPELFKRGGRPTEKSDIYSLGITLWEVAARRVPFADAGDPALISTWVAQGERPAEEDQSI